MSVVTRQAINFDGQLADAELLVVSRVTGINLMAHATMMAHLVVIAEYQQGTVWFKRQRHLAPASCLSVHTTVVRMQSLDSVLWSAVLEISSSKRRDRRGHSRGENMIWKGPHHE